MTLWQKELFEEGSKGPQQKKKGTSFYLSHIILAYGNIYIQFTYSGMLLNIMPSSAAHQGVGVKGKG